MVTQDADCLATAITTHTPPPLVARQCLFSHCSLLSLSLSLFEDEMTASVYFRTVKKKTLKERRPWVERKWTRWKYFLFGWGVAGLLLLLPLLLLGGGSGSFSLNGDGDVSRYPMLMSVFHGRSGAPLSLILLLLSVFLFLSSFKSPPLFYLSILLLLSVWWWSAAFVTCFSLLSLFINIKKA